MFLSVQKNRITTVLIILFSIYLGSDSHPFKIITSPITSFLKKPGSGSIFLYPSCQANACLSDRTINPILLTFKLNRMTKTPTTLLLRIVFTCSIFFFSCNKINEILDHSHLPLPTCEVAEYHVPFLDGFFLDFPLMFRKTYDAKGNLEEIDFAFSNTLGFLAAAHDMIVKYSGQRVFLLSKANPSDTTMTIILNIQGRPVSCTIAAELNDDEGHGYGDTEYFTYKNNRIFSIRGVNSAPHGYQATDTVFYDTHGNPSRFGANSYQYDYTKKVKQQYLDDDQQEYTLGYYICQYLGYFPEVTSPPNLRTHVQADEFTYNLTAYRFDWEGKLVSYSYGGTTADVIVAWHCH